jgi:hypothetical protein
MLAKPAVQVAAQTSARDDDCTAGCTAGHSSTRKACPPWANVCTEKITTLAAGQGAAAPAREGHVQTGVSSALQAAVEAAMQLAVPAAQLHFNKTRKMYAGFVRSSSPQEERLITIRVERHEMLAIERLRT